MILDIIKSVTNKEQDIKIAIAVNDNNEWTTNIIKNLSQKYKSVNIVTSDIKTFKKLEETLFEENGMAITVSNNKRKSFLKADFIINIDFPNEIINKYSINENSTIISMEEKIKIHKKRFNGRIIDNYKIELNPNSQIFEDLNKSKYKSFDLKDIVECYIINNPEQINNIIIC